MFSKSRDFPRPIAARSEREAVQYAAHIREVYEEISHRSVRIHSGTDVRKILAIHLARLLYIHAYMYIYM